MSKLGRLSQPVLRAAVTEALQIHYCVMENRKMFTILRKEEIPGILSCLWQYGENHTGAMLWISVNEPYNSHYNSQTPITVKKLNVGSVKVSTGCLPQSAASVHSSPSHAQTHVCSDSKKQAWLQLCVALLCLTACLLGAGTSLAPGSDRQF